MAFDFFIFLNGPFRPSYFFVIKWITYRKYYLDYYHSLNNIIL